MTTAGRTHKRDVDRDVRYNKDYYVATIHDYDLDVEKREIYLFGREDQLSGVGTGEDNPEPGVEYSLANRFIRNIRILQSVTKDPILIHMKTCGGDWTEGMAIYQAIASCPNYCVILNYTHARSMSSIILQAADHRAMLPYSTFMMHRGTAGFSGTVTQLDTEYEQHKIAERQMMQIYVDRLRECEEHRGKSDRKIEQWIRFQMQRREEVYMSAERAVELNLADVVFGGDGTYDWSKLRS